jgi:hypothetical protein
VKRPQQLLSMGWIMAATLTLLVMALLANQVLAAGSITGGWRGAGATLLYLLSPAGGCLLELARIFTGR